MSTQKQGHLIQFLRQELSVSTEEIELGLRQSDARKNLLPIVLWQYGIVNIHQLNEILDWLYNKSIEG